MTITIHAPQIFLLGLLAYALIQDMIHHGKPQTRTPNAWVTAVATLLIFGLYYWCGLFGGAR